MHISEPWSPPQKRTARDRYQAILEAAAEGIYGLDASGRVTFVNAAAEALTGWTREEQLGKYQHELIHHSYPDGAPYPVESCPVYRTLRTGETHSGEETYWCKHGGMLPVAYTCVAKIDKNGDVVGAVVTFSDRTLQLAERRYRALIEATSDYVWRCDAEGGVIEVDPRWLELSHLSESDVLGWGWLDLFHPNEREEYEQRRAAGIASGKPFSSEYRVRSPGDEYYFFEERLVPVTDADGAIVEWVGIGRDITERKQREHDLQAQAMRDPLTRAFNRRQLYRAMEDEVVRAERSGELFSLLLLDVDHFKAINDEYGHDIGDHVLKKLVEVLSGLIRRTDTLSRWGGEEFAILLPGARCSGASRVAEALRTGIEQTPFGLARPVTISIGLAEYNPGNTAANLIRDADLALYRAKQGGRNRVVTEAR